MAFLDLFKRKEQAKTEPPREVIAAGEKLTLAVSPMETGSGHREPEPAIVEVFDEFGRKRQIAAEEYRNNLLPAALKQHWNDPPALYNMLLDALRLHMASGSGTVLAGARQLRAIDPDHERSAVILSIVLRENSGATEAMRMLEDQLKSDGESAIILVNLSKAQMDLQLEQEARTSLWRGIELDPNMENGVGWFAAMARDGAGGDDEAYARALQKIAALPGSWLAQMWLATRALLHNRQDEGLNLYRESLAHAPEPAPAMLLQSVSGELGKRGLFAEALQLTMPRYRAQVHGLPVGNNLIKLQLETGRLAEAAAMVEELQRMGRPEWAPTLGFWDTEVHKARLSTEPALAPAPELMTYQIDGPVWLPEGSAAQPLFATDPPRAAERILLLVATVRPETPVAPLRGHLADRMGRLSRMWAVFGAEHLYLAGARCAAACVPWVKDGGFAMFPEPYRHDEAAHLARQSSSKYAVTAHLTSVDEDVSISVEVLQTDAETSLLLGSPSGTWPWTEVHLGVKTLLSDVSALLPSATSPAPPLYTLPPDSRLGDYMLRLEQLLAVACSDGETDPAKGLRGEREMVNGTLQLALAAPASLPPRLILHEMLRRFSRVRPEIVAEFEQPVLLLNRRYPLPAAAAVLDTQLEALYPAARRTASDPR